MKKNNKGFTMAELLIVVAITVVLMGVAFIAVQNYQRSSTRLEYDGIAKEIFIAAQNHLTTAQSQGYLQLSADKYGEAGTHGSDNADKAFIVSKDISDASEMLELMLPFGAIDETVRAGGTYIIRYQPSSGRVLDVFYSLPGKSSMLTVSGLRLEAGHYGDLMSNCRGDEHREQRENFQGGVVGWYGGEEGLPKGITLNDPEIIVHNEETLWIEIKDNNATIAEKGDLKLIVTGAISGAQASFDIRNSINQRIDPSYSGENSFKVILDDITQSGFHFADLTAENTGKNFIPGEDIIVEAVAYNNTKLTNVAYSGKKTTNSLFADITEQSVAENGTTTTDYTAIIENFRHLENLDKRISKFEPDKCYKDKDGTAKTINKAEQIKDLLWKGENVGEVKSFLKAIGGDSVKIMAAGTPDDVVGTTSITNENCLCPIDLDYEFTYDGNNHKVSSVEVNHSGPAGLFGNVSVEKSQIKNLELIDFEITSSSGNAGALVGTATNTTITNVLAHNSIDETTKQEKLTKNIEAAGCAGGLVGKTVGSTTVQFSAASLIVNGTTVAGGLIGDAAGTINGCYSGGHTTNGSYEQWVSASDHHYDVIGATAGGLVGTSTATITNSYSTCSVSGSTTAGGFAGSASGIITNCYATGYIDPTAATKFAFVAGELPTGSTGNYYYMTINEVPKTGGKPDETEPMSPYSGYRLTNDAAANAALMAKIKPIDLNAGTYNGFTGEWNSWNPASAYDSALVNYYSGKYTLKTVDELIGAVQTSPTDTPDVPTGYNNWNEIFVSTHYGDWPVPEIFFINTPSG